jgi:hypothetical protein
MPLLRPEGCARRMGYGHPGDMAEHLLRRFLAPPRTGWVTEWAIPEKVQSEMEAA